MTYAGPWPTYTGGIFLCTQPRKGVYTSIQDGGLYDFISNISGNNSKLMYMDSQCQDYKNTANWTTPLTSLSYFLLCAHYSLAA